MKKCPYCSQEIQDEAVICRFCYQDVTKFDQDSHPEFQNNALHVNSEKSHKSRVKNLPLTSFLFGIGMGCILATHRMSAPNWNLTDVILGGFLSNTIIYGLLFFIVVKLWRFVIKKIRKNP